MDSPLPLTTRLPLNHLSNTTPHPPNHHNLSTATTQTVPFPSLFPYHLPRIDKFVRGFEFQELHRPPRGHTFPLLSSSPSSQHKIQVHFTPRTSAQPPPPPPQSHNHHRDPVATERLHRGRQTNARMSEGSEGKIKAAAFLAFAGCALMVVAISTNYWAVLEATASTANASLCESAHLGLWRLCRQQAARDPAVEDGGCRKAHFPTSEIKCAFFKHFKLGAGDDFEVATQKEYSISAAVIGLLSFVLMILGAVCVGAGLRKNRTYMMRPAGLLCLCAGLCVVVSVEVMRQSVNRMIDSHATMWEAVTFSWSFGCALAAATILFVSGVALVLISLPRIPRNPWESCHDSDEVPEQ
uniref:Voltage-dependent calcium channel gamma-1 subunit n=2 Tax=Petromyzon marinus TaxID=7757 RepID=A0AAJ7UCA8_PETMA|nr:voltage-dependent calcium channel gamma-1 subunit [Petromyzon marinus]